MATMNPLERKARGSFIKGIVVAGLIGIIAVAILVIQIINMKTAEKERIAALKTIYVLGQDVKSGQVVTQDMLVEKTVDGSTVPSNAITQTSQLNFILRDQNGNEIRSVPDPNNAENRVLVVVIGTDQYLLTTNDYQTGTINMNGTQQTIIINASPVIAKVNLNANTVLTTDNLAESSEITDDTTRKQEYNVLSLPADLETDDIVDVRLRMPDGTDYIVVSKKTITILDEAGIPSLNTVSMELDEDEILMMSNAIVESYQVAGSMLYVTRYVEPGLQAEAVANYVPNSDVQNLIYRNPNIVDEAKRALNERYNNNADNRNNITDQLNTMDQQERDSAVESGTTQEITTQEQERQSYLDAISGQ